MNASQIADIQRRYRCQLESLLSVDEGVKKIVQALEAKRRAREHPAHLHVGQRLLQRGAPDPQGKEQIYEESIRVPLQMRGPGIPQGETVSDLAINADLAPTIVDVANANPGLVMDGRSLIPVAEQPGIERGRELLIEQPIAGNRGFEAIRTERYMYAEHNTGEKELYDLQKDPFELQSRARPPPLTHPSRPSSLPVCTRSRAAQAPRAGYIRPEPWPPSPRRPLSARWPSSARATGAFASRRRPGCPRGSPRRRSTSAAARSARAPGPVSGARTS